MTSFKSVLSVGRLEGLPKGSFLRFAAGEMSRGQQCLQLDVGGCELIRQRFCLPGNEHLSQPNLPCEGIFGTDAAYRHQPAILGEVKQEKRAVIEIASESYRTDGFRGR